MVSAACMWPEKGSWARRRVRGEKFRVAVGDVVGPRGESMSSARSEATTVSAPAALYLHRGAHRAHTTSPSIGFYVHVELDHVLAFSFNAGM